ncbi:hypothetical protein NFI96_003880 [Prochilodus magdalenae]|nr:hypothetical protein NFI96_003880 [Prochilodus magdalenae]
MREVWSGMKTITGCKQRTDSATDGDAERANEFNTFYNWFDCPVQVSAAPADTSSTLLLALAPDTSVSDCLDINSSPSSFVIHAPFPQADSTDNTAAVSPFSHLLSSDLTCRTTEAHTSPLLHTFPADQTSVCQAERLYVRDCGQQHRSTTGDGTFPFPLHIVHLRLQYNSETCHMQKFSDDTAIVACVRGGQEAEYRNMVENFVAWCHRNNLLLNTSKTKEMVVDFRRARPLTQPVFIEEV